MWYLFNIELGIGSSSEDVFTALRSFSMVVVDGNVKEEREYRGRLYSSLSGVGIYLIIFMTLVLKYWSNLSINVVMGSFGRTRSYILPSSWLEMETSLLELVDVSFNRLL